MLLSSMRLFIITWLCATWKCNGFVYKNLFSSSSGIKQHQHQSQKNTLPSQPVSKRPNQSIITLQPQSLKRIHKSAIILQQSTASTTGISYQIPRIFRGEVTEPFDRSYPSPLHHIYVKNILSEQEAGTCLQLAKEYAKETGAWEQPDSDRHSTYATCDFPIDENSIKLLSYLQSIQFDERIFNQLNELYGIDHSDMDYLDFFCAHYETPTLTNPNVMDRLESHRDGSLLSFTITLSNPNEFEGGGTFFDALRDIEPTTPNEVLLPGGIIRPKSAGACVFHCGKLLHGASTVTSGQRTVLVGFISVAESCYTPGVLAAACRDWGRMDVAKLRSERQKIKKKQITGNKNGWFLNNERWIAAGDSESSRGRSYIRGFCPAFKSVERRGDLTFQRLYRLETEDIFLRSILLDETERSDTNTIYNGDITIL